MPLVLLDDRPLGGLLPDDGRADAARLLRDAVDSVRAPACIAVYGPWGSGKTSMLRALEALWAEPGERSRGPVVWFDPWLYERRSDVLTALLVEIGRTLRKTDGGGWERAKELLAGALKVTVELGVRLGSAALFGGANRDLATLGAMSGISVSDLATLFERADRWTDEVRAVRKQFHDVLQWCVPSGRRLLVLLDDLDRCQPEHALALIEGVKLLLCGDTGDDGDGGTPAVFVFALDRQVVGEAIRQRYPGSSLYTGESYLEKIFDLSVEVPGLPSFDAGRAVAGWIGALGNRDEVERAVGNPKIIVDTLCREPFNNPRVAKRTLNRLSLLVRERGEIVGRIGASHPPSAGETRSSEALARLVGWVATVERYRAFRVFVRSATRGDLRSVVRAVQSQHDQSPSSTAGLSADGIALLSTPGLALALRDRLKLRDNDLEPSEPPPASTLAGASLRLRLDDPRWRNPSLLLIDDLLREVGL